MSDSYDLLKKRLTALGGNAEGRMIQEKLKTLLKALKYSYQAETVVKDNIDFRALINNNKLKMDYDDKIISIPFDSGFKVGDIFYWPRTKQYWIVYLKQYSEDAYFRGFVRRAQHILKWTDEFGTVCQTYGAVVGPVETKIQSDLKKKISFDIPNHTLTIIVPENELTKKLKRYSKVYVSEQMWEVTVSDCISEPGVIELQLIEYYTNKEKDDELINSPNVDGTGGMIENSSDVTVETSLDNIPMIEKDKAYKLWSIVKNNGVLNTDLINNSEFKILDGTGTIDLNGVLIITTPVTIEYYIPKINYKKVFKIGISETQLPEKISYSIKGNTVVKSFGTSTFEAKKYNNGIEDVTIDGEWVYDKKSPYFSVESETISTLVLKWKTGVFGNIKLEYKVGNDIKDSKTIKIESLV